MKTLTVEMLHGILGVAIAAGKGAKKILISSDDEGNSYHELFYSLTEVGECITDSYQLPYGVDMEKAKKEYIVLG